MVIQEPVQAAVWLCLNHYAYSDAIFLAERLYAEVNTEEALFLLATCYYRSGKPVRAYTLLQQKGCPTPSCRFLMAQCCLEINKLSEAESVLAGNILTKQKTLEETVAEFGDSASYALRLLGRVYGKTERLSKASETYKRSLKLNPFLWSSFESLCHLGEKPDSNKIFQVSSTSPSLTTLCQTNPQTPPQIIATITNLQPGQPQDTSPVAMETMETPVTNVTNLQTPQIIQSENNFDSSMETSCLGSIQPLSAVRTRTRPRMALNLCSLQSPNQGHNTPSFGFLPLGDTPSPGNSQNTIPFITPSPVSMGNIMENVQQAPRAKPMTRRSQQVTVPTTKPLNTSGIQSNVPGGVRRSTRLFTSSNTNGTSSSVKENNKSQSQNKKFASPKAPAKKSKTRTSKTPQELNEINKTELTPETKPSTITSTQAQILSIQKQSAEGLMALLGDIGKAYVSLTHYDCAKALQLFSNLPPQHYNTGWILCQVGRAYFEEIEYQKAIQVFQMVKEQFPYHLEGMEFYSTALWHLQKEVQLSALAQHLTELDKNCPETWCATGNCFSLQKEHDTAIKFFQRAVQVDPSFAYAYTLLGHEYVLTEELDKAMSCFRNAIRVDARHYNAWYGIGMIYYKQEKFALAEVHFRKALSINPQSSVLMCHVGAVQHALKKSESALATLNKAIATDPKNPLCKFHRASILFATDKHKEALQELEELKQIVPKESLVYFLIGKVHKKLGNTHLALMNFSWAMDLDPKGANNQIKEAIDKRYVTDEDDPTGGIDDSTFDDIADSSNNSSLLLADDVQLQADESDESL